MNIRKEEEKDYNQVFELIEKAFENEEYSDHREQFLVERLRNSDSFVPDLSLVCEMNEMIVGYILLTKIKIKHSDFSYDSLALAPVAVLPNYQGNGIGGHLIEFAHKKARELGFESIILLGHPTYYPKFGYRKVSDFDIQLPFEVPDENCMAIELVEDALKNINGMVEYPKEFYQ
ncbi:N-acetyltransferase [Empedobacter sp. GD03865]|uniref:GNAT family N-acetyltransferase n=1 Tax=Empedobacter sp. GD03865 TaxID=2975392 RepID=UPI00244B06BF|nr:N-acetyltransferase [Empedobacter sp. GD03865]MDH0660438.1 N-acetyltransferase [Empedobacter sp. GD03865]